MRQIQTRFREFPNSLPVTSVVCSFFGGTLSERHSFSEWRPSLTIRKAELTTDAARSNHHFSLPKEDR